MLLIILLAWLGTALVVIVAGLVFTSNKEPPHYLTLNVIVEERFAENVNEAEREAA
jgi:hypothetical protein